jgi:hypothetical protein
MYDTSGTQSICQPALVNYDIRQHTTWLKAEIARLEDGRTISRQEQETERAMRMLNPIAAEEAYSWFGLLLGLFPPTAIFSRILWTARDEAAFALYVLVALWLLVCCCVVGRLMGKSLAGIAIKIERQAWWKMFFLPALLGALWGIVTGAAGGFFVLGFGALAGIACAVPVGALAFPIFMTLHRALSADGMIDERNLWPLAFGVPCVMASAILGL